MNWEAIIMKKDYAYVLLTTVIFSTIEIALKIIAGAFNPMQITHINNVIALVLEIIGITIMINPLNVKFSVLAFSTL